VFRRSGHRSSGRQQQTNGDAGDFARNIHLRRARFLAGTIGPSLSYFMLWESANNGAPIADATGYHQADDLQPTTHTSTSDQPGSRSRPA
jgi:hypothetical protein